MNCFIVNGKASPEKKHKLNQGVKGKPFPVLNIIDLGIGQATFFRHLILGDTIVNPVLVHNIPDLLPCLFDCFNIVAIVHNYALLFHKDANKILIVKIF